MLKEILAVRDAKTEVFFTPMFFVSKGAAVRDFYDEVSREGSPLKAHPEDYALFHLGVYDDVRGFVAPLEQPVCIASAIDVKAEIKVG